MASLVLVAPAQAATPFTAGVGELPSVAVGSDGSGHVAWETDEENDKVGYCRLSPGASTCNHTALLSFPGAEAYPDGRAQVFAPAPNVIVIAAGCWGCPDLDGDVYRWISTNNGESFGTPTRIGYENMGGDGGNNGLGIWLQESGIFVGTDGPHVKAHGPGPTATLGNGVEFASGGFFGYSSGVVRAPGSNTLVAATNDGDTVKYAVSSVPLTVSNLNNPVNWATDLTLPAPEGDDSDTALNSGPSGVTLTYLDYLDHGDTHVGLRRFDSTTSTFGGPIHVEGNDPIDDHIEDNGEPSSFQDPAGRIHVVWDSAFGNGRLRYTVSNTSGNNFSAAANIAASEAFYDPQIAAGADGHGFATWAHVCAGCGGSGAIRVVPLDPYPEPAPPVTPPAPSSPAAPAAPAAAPQVGGFRTARAVLRPGQATVFRFRSSRPGLAVLSFEKRFRGVQGKRKGRKACLPLTRKRLRALRRRAGSASALGRLLRNRRCHGFRRIGRLRQRVTAGLNTIRFSGRLAGRKLSPGRYRARLVVRDNAGLLSRVETLRFKVVAKHGSGRSKKPHRGR